MASSHLRRQRERRRRRGGVLASLRALGVSVTDGRTREGKSRNTKREHVEAAREKFERWQEADEAQRRRELEDLAIYAGEMWPQDVKDARAGLPGGHGQPPVPARPCLVINKLREPVSQVLSQIRDAELGIELTPADDFEGLGVILDTTEITLREGLIRRIQRDSQAINMRYWAAERAAIAGRGFYGVMTRFSPGKTFDQELYVTGWYNQACVTPDPAHEQPDGSDMEGVFIGTWISWAEYKATWPNAAKKRNLISALNKSDFEALGDEAPAWFKGSDEDLQMVYVVDHFYLERTTRTLAQLADGSVEWKDVLSEDAEIVDEREVIEQTVKWEKLDGVNPEPLEETDWPTPDIPIIKVVGDELQPYDAERRTEGLVRPAKDSNQGFNAMASKLVEVVALTPIPGVVMAAGQDEGFEKEWDLATTRTLSRLHYNYKDADGQPVGAPAAINRDTPIQPLAMALQMFDEAVQTTSRRHDPSLGKVDPTLRSGKAITQVINQSKEGTSNFGDNLRRSIRREAEILNNALYPVYGTRPGRLAKIVNCQGEPETVMLGQPYTLQGTRPLGVLVPHPATGVPMPAPINTPNLPEGAQQYQLTEHANCNVNITITRNYDTRRQEQTDLLGSILAQNPEMMTVFGDIFFAHQDGPGHEELAERVKLMLAPPIQAALAAKGNGNQVPMLQQQLQQAQQIMQQGQQEIQTLQQKLQAKEAEQQGKLAIEQERQKHEDLRAAMDREVKIAVAEIAAQAKQTLQDMALFYEERSRIGAQIHEHAMGGREALHDLTLAKHAAVADAAQSDLEHQQTLVEQQQAHEHTLAQGQQGAALAPPPASSDGAAAAGE